MGPQLPCPATSGDGWDVFGGKTIKYWTGLHNKDQCNGEKVRYSTQQAIVSRVEGFKKGQGY